MDQGEFVVSVWRSGQSTFLSQVLASPAGEGVECPFRIPPSAERLRRARADWRRAWQAAPADAPREEEARLDNVAATFGADLFRALFVQATGELFYRSLGKLDERGALPLRLRFDPGARRFSDLHELRWELLRHPDMPGRPPRLGRRLFGLSAQSPIIRHLETDHSERAPIRGTLRILAVGTTSAEFGEELALDVEIENLRETCADRDVELRWIQEANLNRVREELVGFAPHVLHYMGHATYDRASGQVVLPLTTRAGPATLVSAAELAPKLADCNSLRLVCLNACSTASESAPRALFAGIATTLVAEGIPAVVAMQDFVADDTAIAFARAFYRHLATGAAIDAAVVEGRQAIHSCTPRSVEWSAPVLFLRGPARPIVSLSHPRSRATARPKSTRRAVDVYVRHLERTLPRQFVLPWLRPSLSPRVQTWDLLVPLHAVALEGHPDHSNEPGFVPGPRPWSPPRAVSANPLRVDVSALLRDEPYVLLVGPAGAGKSTLALQTAWHQARAAVARSMSYGDEVSGCGGRVPFVVDGRAWAVAWRAGRRSRLEDLLFCELQEAGVEARESAAAVRGVLERGGFCVFVDGLDRAGDVASRAALARAIEDFVARWVVAAWLDSAAPTPVVASGPWRQVVVTTRPGDEIPHDIVKYELASLDDEAIRAFCAAWDNTNLSGKSGSTDSVHARPALAEVVERVDVAGRRLTRNPLGLSLLAVAHTRASPLRRATVYESVIGMWIDLAAQRRNESGQALDRVATRRAIEDLAMASHEQEGDGLNGLQIHRLVHESAGDAGPGVLAALRADPALVTPRDDDGGWFFTSRCFEEYLAACSLVRDDDGAVERLAERLSDAHWAALLPLALARLSARLDGAGLSRALSAWLDSAAGGFPHAELLVARAAPEMVHLPSDVAERSAYRLIDAYGSGAARVPCMVIEEALRDLGGVQGASVERAIVRHLHAGTTHGSAGAARLTQRLAVFTSAVATALREALDRDTERCDVDRALRALARADAGLLPDERNSFRRTLARRPELTRRVLASASWRRLVLAVYGGLPETGAGHGSALYRESSTLSSWITATLEAALPPESLLEDLRDVLRAPHDARAFTDAFVAALALGEPAKRPPRRQAATWARIEARLEGVEIGIDETLPAAAVRVFAALAEQADMARLSHELWLELLTAVLHTLSPRMSCAGGLLRLLVACPPAIRTELSAELWHAVLGGAGDVVYNFAVLLDTHGAVLAASPLALARTLARLPLAAGVKLGRAAGLGLDPLAIVDDARDGVVAAALDVLAALPHALDFVCGWALGVLEPLLVECGYLDEALAMANTLSDKLGARDGALSRLLPAWSPEARRAGTDLVDELVARAHAATDPYRRFRVGFRLASGFARLRATLADRSNAQNGAPEPWRRRILGFVGARPEPSDPLFAAAVAIADPRRRARAFAKLAQLAEDPTRKEAIERARQAVAAVGTAEERARMRSGIALLADTALAEHLWREALADARAVSPAARRMALVDDLGRACPDTPRARQRWLDLVESLPAEQRCRALGLHGRFLLAHENLLGGADAVPIVLAALRDDERRLAEAGQRAGEGLKRAWTGARHTTVIQVQRETAADISPRTLPTLIEALTASDDATRQDAGSKLSNGWDVLATGELGLPAIERVARDWLAAHEADPARALVLLWFLERLEHNDADLLHTSVSRACEDPRGAHVVLLRSVNSLTRPVWQALIDGLRAPAAHVQRALLHSVATLLARRRVSADVWPAVSSALSTLPEALDDQTCVLNGPGRIALAIEKADPRSRVLRQVEVTERTFATGRRRIGELLRLPPPAMRDALAALGRVRIVGPCRTRAVYAAAHRLDGHAHATRILLSWLHARLRDAAQPEEPYVLLLPDLLGLAVMLAERHPGELRAFDIATPLFVRQLAEQAQFASFYTARADAQRLLSLLGRVTPEVVKALKSGARDVGPVQAATFNSLGRYCHVSEDALEGLVMELRGTGTAAVYACARAAAAIARHSSCATTRRHLTQEIWALLDSEDARRSVHMWWRTPSDPRRAAWQTGVAGTLAELLTPEVLGVARGTVTVGAAVEP